MHPCHALSIRSIVDPAQVNIEPVYRLATSTVDMQHMEIVLQAIAYASIIKQATIDHSRTLHSSNTAL